VICPLLASQQLQFFVVGITTHILYRLDGVRFPASKARRTLRNSA
jgi:hypothetical protein